MENQPAGKPATAPPNAATAAEKSSRAAAGGSAETPGAADAPPTTLGAYLTAARERRGVSREQVSGETRIPEHYVRMIESNDYSMIADQLYMVPFIRRYAAFLDLDPEEVAMRFVREVQRADSVPQPRLDHPLDIVARKRGGRRGGLIVVAVLTMVAGLYYYQSEHHRQAIDNFGPHAGAAAVAPLTGAPAPAAPSSRALPATSP